MTREEILEAENEALRALLAEYKTENATLRHEKANKEQVIMSLEHLVRLRGIVAARSVTAATEVRQ